MVKAKAYVCNRCRKFITYSPDEAGQTMSCPFCKSPISLPAAPFASSPSKRREHRPWSPAIWVVAVSASLVAGSALLLPWHGRKGASQVVPLPLPAFTQERITVAPAPARVRGQHVTVAVTDVWYGCPEIYQAALNKTVSTETPVCCVRISVTNSGKEGVAYRSWRVFEASADKKLAELRSASGTPYSLVSFGAESYPVGAQRKRELELAPGNTLTDLVLFLCDAKPTGDLSLTLPCANMDAQGELRFTIPSGLIR